MKTTNCSSCGSVFECGHPGSCWCSQFPQIIPLDTVDGCLCRNCLLDLQNKKIDQFIDKTPLRDALKQAAKYNNDALIEGLDYIVLKGKWIFTKWYHLKRGYCCYNGCVHCPY